MDVGEQCLMILYGVDPAIPNRGRPRGALVVGDFLVIGPAAKEPVRGIERVIDTPVVLIHIDRYGLHAEIIQTLGKWIVRCSVGRRYQAGHDFLDRVDPASWKDVAGDRLAYKARAVGIGDGGAWIINRNEPAG